LRQYRAVAFMEPIEHESRDVGVASPCRLKLWTIGDCQQHRESPHPVHREIQQLARGWVDPVSVLKNRQHRSAPRLGFELSEQCLE
jgi:hypothetical protein